MMCRMYGAHSRKRISNCIFRMLLYLLRYYVLDETSYGECDCGIVFFEGQLFGFASATRIKWIFLWLAYVIQSNYLVHLWKLFFTQQMSRRAFICISIFFFFWNFRNWSHSSQTNEIPFCYLCVLIKSSHHRKRRAVNVVPQLMYVLRILMMYLPLFCSKYGYTCALCLDSMVTITTTKYYNINEYSYKS